MLWGNFCTVVISVLQIAGLIVALLMHKGKIKWGKEWTKYLILVLAIVFVFLNFSSYSWFESAEATIQENANVPVSAAECIGKNKTDVINNLRRAGFRNVHEETIADLEIADAAKDGVVEAISINGVSDFKGNEEFKKDAKVVVTYHTYKCVSMPFASKDIKNMEENEIYEALKEIGFISIETEEVFDLDPDTTDAECEYGLSINGTSVFEKNAEFPINAEVTIVTHRVYDKYTVTISVDFLSSIFFDLYDVEMNVDGNKEVLKHGEDGVYTYQMPSGKYTVTFRNVDSTSVKGTAEFELYEDMEIGYQISCYSEEVKVEELYTEKKSAVGENEAYVPCAEDACYDKNYQEILSTFKDAGFTNIKTEILYDIVWGFTEEGAVESVSINGNENFKKGDIFLKDAPIVITYHMKEEDDPNKEVEATKHTIETPNNEGPLYYTTNNYEQACEGNCGVFAYKSKGGVYDIYWIVDFEDGYIYKLLRVMAKTLATDWQLKKDILTLQSNLRII